MEILLFTLNLQRKRREEMSEGASLSWWRRLQTTAASPDPVASTTVPPSTLNLLEPMNAALLPPEAAAWPVNVVDPWFGVYCKV